MEKSSGGSNFSSGGYFSLAIEPRIVDKREILPGPFKAMFDLPEIQNKMDSFLNEIFGEQSIPEMYIENNVLYPSGESKLAFVNIAGRAVILPVPSDIIENEKYQIMGAGDEASCSCTDGNCEVESKSGLGGEITWCEGNCSGTCTLNTYHNGVTSYQAITYHY